MSVIVEHEGEFFLYIKGADDIITEFLDIGKSPNIDVVSGEIERASRKGLRNMMIAYKKIIKKDWYIF